MIILDAYITLPEIGIVIIIAIMLLAGARFTDSWRLRNKVFYKMSSNYMSCKKCGQLWKKHHYGTDFKKTMWVEYSTVKDKDCVCHDLNN